MKRLSHPVALASLALAITLTTTAPRAAGAQDSARARPVVPNPLRFQFMGPASGGRVSAIVGAPGNAKVWYLGNASGGIFRSRDSGMTFQPVFDKQPVQAIGALAISQSDPSQVWAGTGEAWTIRDADIMGDGVYFSADSGTTWRNMGLRESGRIGRIIVHPTDPRIVFVCALGRVTGPQEERGVYRTTDGGAHWTRVLHVDRNTGCSGLSIDAQHPEVLFAGMWQVEMHTYAMYSGGPSSGIYVSRDSGTTWSHVVHPGLPASPVGKIDVAVAPSDSRRVYALIQTPNQGSLWRSDDGGVTWSVSNWTRALIGRAGYYIRLGVSPANADEVLVANSSFFRSNDGGRVFKEVRWGGDNHDIWYDPTNANRIGLTNDADARLSLDHGKNWKSATLPNSQMYHVAVDQETPYWIYTNRQDNGTMRGPSTYPEGDPNAGPGAAGRTRRDSIERADSITMVRRTALAAAGLKDTTVRDSVDVEGGYGPGTSTSSVWDHGLGGCESGFTLPDVTDTNIVWASCYGNTVTRYDHRTKLARSVSPWAHTLDSPPNESKYRCHWTPPLAIDPFDHNTVYYGCQVIFATRDAGQSWKVISPDLSTQDSSRIVSSGGIVGDNLGQFYGEVVFAIAPSEIRRGLIWAGTNDGKIWNTRNGGTSWTDVTRNSGFPTWGTIRKIEPSRFDPATAYAVVDAHMMDDRKPYLFKTTDYGASWHSVVGDLPSAHPLDYVLSMAENPNRRGMLFAGTGHAFYYSMDDGAHWTPYNEGLPAAPVSWIVVPKRWHDVVVSTYGRGVFIMKDITALERKDEVVAGAPAHLFAPRPGYRQLRGGRAEITFSLAAASATPVRIEILDSTGVVVRTIKTPTRAGINRAVWDLREDAPKRPLLRTVAPDNPHIWEEPRFLARDARGVTHWGIQAPQTTGPVALPGHYSVRLTSGSSTATQPLEIVRASELKTSAADLAASTAAQRRIRDNLNTVVDLVNRIEVMRKQLEDQRVASAGTPAALAAVNEMDRRMLDVELQLLSHSDLNSDDKYYVEPYKLYLRLVWLSGEVGGGAGDVAGGADHRPTNASMQVLAEIERDLARAKRDFATLMQQHLQAYNRAMPGTVGPLSAGMIP
ncbi:MAG: hypothetical protein JWN79_3419 [Gemmatimonadetes bacterium]|nr:hypothetical protein [Gemmatimonadota bacterium]